MECTDKTLDYLIRHLTEFGNTVLPLHKDEKYYLRLLAEHGIECESIHRPEFVEGKRSKNPYIIFKVKGKTVPYKSNYQKYDMHKRFNQ